MATTAITGTVGKMIVVKSFQVDAYGGTSNTPVTWSSSASTVAAVQNIYNTNNAMVYCLTPGTATITATMTSTTATVTQTITITVNAPGTFDGYKLEIDADASFQPVNKTGQTQTS